MDISELPLNLGRHVYQVKARVQSRFLYQKVQPGLWRYEYLLTYDTPRSRLVDPQRPESRRSIPERDVESFVRLEFPLRSQANQKVQILIPSNDGCN